MEHLPAVFLFAVSASVTPGPNNVMIMASGVNFGVKRSLPHLLGICIGFPVMLILVGSGLGYVFEQSPVIHELIKIAGVFYLLYLAWVIANAAPDPLKGGKSRPIRFVEAALFQWVNPKAWIMATGAVAAYTSLSVDIHVQVVMIALVFFLVVFPCSGAWLILGVWLKKLFISPVWQRKFNCVMALLLVISIWPIVYELLGRYVI